MNRQRIFIAGATGAIGNPLVTELLEAGHDLHCTFRSPASEKALQARGCSPVSVDVFDRSAVLRVVEDLKPTCIVHQLTVLPRDATPAGMAEGVAKTSEIRRVTVPIFAEAAQRVGARFVTQSMSFVTVPEGPSVHDETAPLWLDAPEPMATTNRAIQTVEKATLDAGGLSLRYGFFYGPGTWYAHDGALATMLAKRMLPIVGKGGGVSSFVDIADAAHCTALAIESGPSGIYNVCDDDPQTQVEYLPAMARMLGAKPPRRFPPFLVRWLAGPVLVHYGATLRGNDNAKARETWAWRPRPWSEGMRQALSG